MNVPLISIIISLVGFISFLTFILAKFGVQKSISDSYYTFKSNGIKTIWFEIGIMSFAFPMFFTGGNGLLPLAAALICFVAAASAFKKRNQTKIIHYAGAIGGILAGVLSLIIEHNMWVPVLFSILLALLIKLFIKNYIWWIEILFYFTIVLSTLSTFI